MLLITGFAAVTDWTASGIGTEEISCTCYTLSNPADTYDSKKVYVVDTEPLLNVLLSIFPHSIFQPHRLIPKNLGANRVLKVRYGQTDILLNPQLSAIST